MRKDQLINKYFLIAEKNGFKLSSIGICEYIDKKDKSIIIKENLNQLDIFRVVMSEKFISSIAKEVKTQYLNNGKIIIGETYRIWDLDELIMWKTDTHFLDIHLQQFLCEKQAIFLSTWKLDKFILFLFPKI